MSRMFSLDDGELLVRQLETEESKLNKKQHIEALFKRISNSLPKDYQNLVPSQTWAVYWILHSLALMKKNHLLETLSDDVIQFMNECKHEHGGYGGGPGQISHVATTFGAVNALITLANEEALESIDRVSLVKFLNHMKQPNGSFSTHDDGEIDCRASYCALAVMKCLNINNPPLMENVADWLLSCQTYEGGFGSVPGAEAHGGYTFCCVASLCLLNQLHRADLHALLRWLTSKQMSVDGGFCGRSNKLVDSCYSYWQGAVFPLIHPYLKRPDQQKERTTRSASAQTKSKDQNPLASWLFDCAALQDYILNQCQCDDGLLVDKPGCMPDFYHTCYALSGLSISQHQPGGSVFDIGSHEINILNPTHAVFNLTPDTLTFCLHYFSNKKIVTLESEGT